MNSLNNTLKLPAIIILSAALSLFGCEQDEEVITTPSTPELRLSLPDSLTGGVVTTNSRQGLNTRAGTEGPCFYQGVGDEDPFVNGYSMTRFMVSAITTWTCVADTLIDIAEFFPHDGLIYESDNDLNAVDYDPDEPTHYSITDDATNQVSIRLYYAYDRATPPTANDDPGFFVSWVNEANNTVRGRLVIDSLGINEDDPNDNSEDPVAMRIDFTYDDNEKYADMYLKFDDGNSYANGLRIEVTHDLNANPLTQVYLARGIMDMKAQFWPDTGIAELPALQMYTVSDQLGEGAAIAEFVDLALPLEINADYQNHLGNYLFTKTDKYFFDADQTAAEPWDFIEKQVSSSEYRGGRTTPLTGGSWIPFNPSLDMLINAFVLDNDYFTGSKCAAMGDDCTELLNAIFLDGFAGQEPNQGTDPLDWRSTAIGTPDYLTSVYPDGIIDWNGVFDPVFYP